MSGSLSRSDVDRLASLAHLELDDAEAEALTRQLADFLAYAVQVQQLSTSDVPPTTHVLTPRAPLRPDVPDASLPTAKALENGPDVDRAAGLFRVPRVIG
jgi:aspartyl-tRNA(Asn)/glutamyl-tRNA(Gln) amidotransferase subunit C